MKTMMLAGLGLLSCASFAQGFSDTFDSINPGWVQDRYDTQGFNSTFFDGDNRLEVTIGAADGFSQRTSPYNSGFYDFQGRQRSTGIGGTGVPWRVSGDVYVSNDMMSGTTNYDTEIWVRDSALNENDAYYPSAWFGRYDVSNFGVGTNLSTVLGAWDADLGNPWVEVTLASVLPTFTGNQWLTLAMEYDGSKVDYFANGVLYYSDTTASPLAQGSAQTVFLNSYNFDSGVDQTVYWDNVNAVPEPATMTALALGAAALMRRKKK